MRTQYEEEQDREVEILKLKGLTYERYNQIRDKYHLPDLIETVQEVFYKQTTSALPWSRELQIELQDLSCYFKMIGIKVEDILSVLTKEQLDVAVSRNRKDLIRHIEGGAGFIEEMRNCGFYYARGTEDDILKVLEWSKKCVGGCECSIRYYGLAALLYSKPEYYIRFIVDGIDGEFQIVVPNHGEYEERFDSVFTDKRTPSDLRITFEKFGSGVIETIARGADEEELNKNFSTWLSEYKNDATEYGLKKKEEFFNEEYVQSGLEYFKSLIEKHEELRP